MPKGEPLRYFREVVLPYEGDDCLFWPFARNDQGYGTVVIESEHRYVHRMACEHAHGKPPTPKHQSAHSCGKGHLGCCTKRHVSWKTAVENSADRYLHGTEHLGARCHNARLTEEEVREIRAIGKSMTRRALASRYGVSIGAVNNILYRNSWSWLDQSRS